MVYHSMTRTLPTQCHLMFLRHHSGCFSIETFEMRLSHSYLKNWQTGPIKGEGKYFHGKLKMWKDCIKTNFHG